MTRKATPFLNDLSLGTVVPDVTVSEIAKRYGVCWKTAAKWVQSIGVPAKGRGNRTTPRLGVPLFKNRRTDHDAVLADLATGMTLRAVAAKHGVSFQAVAYIRNAANGRISALWETNAQPPSSEAT